MNNETADVAWGAVLDSFYVEPRDKPCPNQFLANFVRTKDSQAEPEPVAPHIREADHLYNEPFKVLSDYGFKPKLLPLPFHAYNDRGRRSTIKNEESDDASDIASSNSPNEGNHFSSSQGRSPSALKYDSPTVTNDPNGFAKDERGDAKSSFFSGLIHLNKKKETDTHANTYPIQPTLPREPSHLTMPRKVSTGPNDVGTPKERATKPKRSIHRSKSKKDMGITNVSPQPMDVVEATVEENKGCLAYRASHFIENKSNDDIEKISTELLNGEDIYENSPVVATKRLVSYYQPHFGWKPSHVTLCHRQFLTQYPEPKPTKFVVHCTSLLFDGMPAPEPLFLKLFLLDVSKDAKKISEDFYFHMNEDGMMHQCVPEKIRKGMSDSKSVTFTVTYPNPDVYLILLVYRVPVNENEDTIKQYRELATKMISEKMLEPYILAKDSAGFFRQPFLFGAHPLIDIAENTTTFATTRREPSPIQTPNNPKDMDVLMQEYKDKQAQLQTTMQLVTLRTGRQEISPLWTISSNASTPFNIGEFLKPSKSGSMKSKLKPMKGKFSFDITLLSNRRTLDIGYTTLFANPTIVMPEGLGDDTDSVSTSPNMTQSYGTPVDDHVLHVTSDNLAVFSESPSNSMLLLGQTASAYSNDFDAFDTSLRNSLKQSVQELNSVEVGEFPLMKPSFPFIQYINTLYVYPLAAVLKDASGVSNVIMEVMFREDDATFQDPEGSMNIVSPHDQLLCTFDLSSITLGEKNPQFFEEFKVQLPVALQRGHHLLFVLYNIDDDEIDKTKKKKSSKKDKAIIAKERAELGTWERKIIGYAYLDLIGQVAADLKSPNEWEHVPGECVFTDVAKLIVIKNLCMHYMHANAQLDTYGNKCRIEVATMLHSTLYPADNIIHRFYWVLTEIERVHVQNQCVDEQLTNLISVLKGFRVIDYTTLLPYAPLILNTLFRLLATANAFNLEKLNINNVETALFEALLVFLRGIYLVTGKEFTRKNRTFMSYVQFIFFNCTEKIYSPLPAYVFIPKLYLSFLKDSKYNTAEFGNEDAPTVKSEKKKGLFSNKKKVVSVTKDESSEAVSERDALRFSWFFFDIIIKSLTLALKGEKKIVVQNNYDDLPGFERTGAVFEKNETIPMAHHENGWDFGKISENNEKSAKSLFETLLQVVEPFCMKVMKLMRNTKPQAHIGKHANRNMALFLRDLFPILPRIYTIQLIQKYLNTMTATDASIILLKVEFCTILMDYDHFVSVNIGSHGPVLAHQCMDVIYEILSLKRQQTAEKGISLLLAHLTKMDHDARHDDERFIHRREQLAELYIPFVGRVLSNGEMLCYFVQDKSHTDLIICMLWIMSNMSRQKLVEWWQQQDKNVIYRTCRFLELAAAALFLQPDHELCKEGVLVVKDLVALFVAPTTLKPIIGNFSLMEKPSEEEKTEERFEDEFESPFLPHPYVTLLMRYLSHMLMNLIVSSNVHATTNSITGQLFTRFYFSILETFLENYMEEVTCLFMYHGEQKLPILHQKKVETKWRWLLGVVLLNSELKSETMSKQLLKCMHLLIDPYLNDAEYLRHNKELSEADMEGDIVYDDKDGTKTIRGATLKKLIERLIQHSDIVDSEGNKFKKTFLLTYFSFTTPRDLLAQLVKLYNIKFEEGDSAAQLNSLNFIQEWVKKGFHDFDNFAIAELIQFLSTLEVNPITRTKMRKPIMKQLLGVQTQHMVTAQKEQYEPSEVPKDFDLEAMETPVMPIKKWKQLKKKMNVNPFDYPFDILQWSALEIARQMTIIESELFNAVEPKECFGLAWSKENKEDLAPNLVALSNRFQQVTLWIVNTILSERDLKKRQSVLLKWIEIMREAYALKNFASVYQISAALNSAEIGRLSKTKEAIDSKDLEFCEHTLDFSKSNYRILRNLIKESAGSATIPFIGVYLTDLTFTNDGNVDDIPHAVVPNRQLINFTKRRLYSTSIVDIQLLQQSCKFPKLRPIPYLQYILRDHINQGITWATEKERYNQSLELEPRK